MLAVVTLHTAELRVTKVSYDCSRGNKVLQSAMTHNIALGPIGLGAVKALELLHAAVCFHVQLESARPTERLATGVAVEVPLPPVDRGYVRLQGDVRLVRVATLVTGKAVLVSLDVNLQELGSSQNLVTEVTGKISFLPSVKVGHMDPQTSLCPKLLLTLVALHSGLLVVVIHLNVVFQLVWVPEGLFAVWAGELRRTVVPGVPRQGALVLEEKRTLFTLELGLLVHTGNMSLHVAQLGENLATV